MPDITGTGIKPVKIHTHKDVYKLYYEANEKICSNMRQYPKKFQARNVFRNVKSMFPLFNAYSIGRMKNTASGSIEVTSDLLKMGFSR